MIEWLKSIFNLAKANNEFAKATEQRLIKIENMLKMEEAPTDDGDGSSIKECE